MQDAPGSMAKAGGRKRGIRVKREIYNL